MDYDLQQNSVCLKWDTKRALIEIARALDENPDVLADNWLAVHIATDFPQVVAHIRAQSERTETFRKELEKQLKPKLNPIKT